MSQCPAARPVRPARPSRLLAAPLVLAALLVPAAAAALEPRFDHRDQQGLLAGLSLFRDSVTGTGSGTTVDVRPALRLAYAFDVSGEGDELILGAAGRLGGWSDPERVRTLLALDARYRGYFGTEELKTFFEVGLWSQLRSRFAIGPMIGLGVAYDPTRAWGLYTSLEFGTGFGAERVFTFGGTVGVQLRFE
jgi:hypothetical protein